MFDGNARKKARINVEPRNYISPSEFIFSPEEERLLCSISVAYPLSPLWSTEPASKIAALIDLYDGFFPDCYVRNEALVLVRSQQLVDYCTSHWRPLPRTRGDNPIFAAYREERDAHCRVFAVFTKQIFFNAESAMHLRMLEPLMPPASVIHIKNKMG